MAYVLLDWTITTEVKLAVQELPYPDGIQQSRSLPPQHLTIYFTKKLQEQLLESFQLVFSDPKQELRLSLPQNWTLYCKLKTGDSRLFLAHPQTGEWVGTILIEASFAQRLLEKLSQLKEPGQKLAFNTLGRLNALSNFELEFALSAEA